MNTNSVYTPQYSANTHVTVTHNDQLQTNETGIGGVVSLPSVWISEPVWNHWDVRFLRIAEEVASWSKDPSTKTGAVIVDQERRIISTGFNGFPQAMLDNPAWYEDRDEKYSRIVHCEVNAVLFARQSLAGSTLYTWPLLSCDRCVVQMLQAGITRFVAPTPSEDIKSRWGKALDRTRQYITECGLKYVEIERKHLGLDD